VIHQTCAFLEAHRIEYALVGGFAAAVWGQPRATFDVDVVVAAGADRVEHLRAAIRQEPAFLLEPETLSFPPYTLLLRAHMLEDPSSAEPGLIVIDFLFMETELARTLLSRRQRVDLAGCPVWVCSAEDLILLKLIAGRAQDLDDIRGILAVRPGRIDLAYIEAWVPRLKCQPNWALVTS
jgi:hypothetical protein